MRGQARVSRGPFTCKTSIGVLKRTSDQKGLETMFGKKTILVGAIAAAVGFGSRYATADTISVTNYSLPYLAVVPTSSVVANGVADFYYDVSFSATADVSAGSAYVGPPSTTNGTGYDGFSVTDFAPPGAVTSASLSYLDGVSWTGVFTLLSPFPAGHGQLVGFTGNALGKDSYSDAYDGGGDSGTILDNNSEAVEYDYLGSTNQKLGSGDLLLTVAVAVTTLDDTYNDNGGTVGVDQSGTPNTFGVSQVYTLGPGSMIPVPLPPVGVAGLSLFGLLGLSRFVRSRRVMA